MKSPNGKTLLIILVLVLITGVGGFFGYKKYSDGQASKAEKLILGACVDVQKIMDLEGTGSIPTIINANLDSAIKQASEASKMHPRSDETGFAEFTQMLQMAKSTGWSWDTAELVVSQLNDIDDLCEGYKLVLNQ